jgi:hypothetical protein
MPLIYSSKLSELYRNTCYIPSSIVSSIVPTDYPLVTDGNGGTFWEILDSDTIIADNLNVLVTSSISTFISSLSVGTIAFPSGNFENLYANRTAAKFLEAEAGTATQPSIGLLLTEDINTSTATIANFFVSTLVADSVFTNVADFDILNTNSISTNLFIANEGNVSSLTTDNLFILNYQGTELSNATTVLNSLLTTNALSTNLISTSRIEADQFSTLNLNVSSVNGFSYPFGENIIGTQLNTETTDVKFSTIASTVLTTTLNTNIARINELVTSTFQTNYVSTGILETKILTAGLTLNSTISTTNLVTDSFFISSANLSSVQTSAFFFNTLNTSTFFTSGLSSFHLNTVSSLIENATLDTLNTNDLVAQKVTVDLLKTPSANISTFYASTISSLETRVEYVSSSTAFSDTYTTSSLLGNTVSSLQFYTESLSTGLTQVYFISTNYAQFSSQIVDLLSTNNLNTEYFIGGDASFLTGLVLDDLTASTFITKSATFSKLETEYVSSTNTYASTLTTHILLNQSLSTQQIYTDLYFGSSITSEFISTGYVETTQSYGEASFISSLQATVTDTSSFVGTAASTQTVKFVSAFTDSLTANTLNANEVSTIFISTNILFLSTFETNSLSTINVNISSGTFSSLYQPDIFTQSFGFDSGLFSTLNVNQLLQSTSNIVDTFSSLQTIAQTMEIGELYVSSINGEAYPPLFDVNPNLVTKYLTVANYTSSSSTFVESVSSSQISVFSGQIGSLFTDSVSSLNFRAEDAQISSVVGTEVFSISGFSANLYASSINLSTLSSGYVYSESAFFSTLAANSVSSFEFSVGSSIVKSVFSADTVSSYTLFSESATLQAATFSSISAAIVYGNFSMDTLTVNTISTVNLEASVVESKNLYTSLLSTQGFQISTMQGLSLNTSTLSIQQAFLNSAEIVTLDAKTISTGAFAADSIAANSTLAYFISAGTVKAEAIDANTIAYLNSVSSVFLEASVLNAQTAIVGSTIYTLKADAVAATVGSTFTSSITMSQDTLTANTLETSTIYANIVSSVLGFTDSMYLKYLSTTYISSGILSAQNASISTINASYISSGEVNTSIVSTQSLNVDHLSTNRFDTRYVSANQVQAGDLISFSTIANTISTNHIDAYSISTYSATVWGTNTLLVQGSSIFTSGFVPNQGISVVKIEDLIVQTLNTGSQVSANSIAVPFLKTENISVGSITNAFGTTTSTLLAYAISSSQLTADTTTLFLQQIQTNFVSSSLISTAQLLGSTLIGDSIYGIQSIDFVSSISSSALETGSAFITSAALQAISTNSLIVNTGFITALSTNSISTSVIEAGRLVFNTISTNQFTACNVNALQGEGNYLSTNHISAGAIYGSSIFGRQFRTDLISTTTVSMDSLRLSVGDQIQTPTISTMEIEGVFGNGIGVSSLQASARRIIGSVLDASAISTFAISTATMEQSELNVLNLYASSVSTSYLGSLESRWNLSTLYTSSIVGSRIDGRYAEIKNIQTSTFSGTIASASTLLQSLSANLISVGRLSVNTVFTEYVSTNFLSTAIVSARQIAATSTFTDFLSSAQFSTNRAFAESISSITTSSITSRFQELIGGNWNIQFISTARLDAKSINVSTLSTSFISSGIIIGENLSVSSFVPSSISTSFIFGGDGAFGFLQINSLSGPTIQAENFNANKVVAEIISTNTLRIENPVAISSISPYFLDTDSINSGSTITIALNTNYLSTASFSNITTNNYPLQESFMNFSTLRVSTLLINSISTPALTADTYFVSTMSSLGSLVANSLFTSSFNINFLSVPTLEIYENPISTTLISTRELYVSSASVSNVLNRQFFNVYNGLTNSTIAISTFVTNTYNTALTTTFSTLSVVSTMFISSYSSSITTKNDLFRFSLSTNTFYSDNVQGNSLLVSSLLNYSTMSVDGTINLFNSVEDSSIIKSDFIIQAGNNFSNSLPFGIVTNSFSSNVRYSEDSGVTWTNATMADPMPFPFCLAYNGSYWLMGGSNGPSGTTTSGPNRSIQRSTDGKYWVNTSNIEFTNSGAISIAWGDNKWVAMGTDSTTTLGTIKYSTDGWNWNNITGVGFSVQSDIISRIGRVAYANNIYLAGGRSNSTADGSPILRSTDGIFWQKPTTAVPANTTNIQGLAFGNGVWVATCEGNSTTANASNLYSIDNGNTWLRSDYGFFTGTNTTQYFRGGWSVVYNNKFNLFLACGTTGANGTTQARIKFSTNGSNWQDTTGDTVTNPFLGNITYNYKTFIAANYNQSNFKGDFLFSTNGRHWNASNNYSFNTFATRSILAEDQNSSPIYNILNANNTRWDNYPIKLYNKITVNTTNSDNLLLSFCNVTVLNNTLYINPSTNQVTINTLGQDTAQSTFRLFVNGQINVATDTTDLVGGASANWAGLSDKRIKTQIVPADLELCKKNLQKIPLVHYRFNEELYPTGFLKDTHMLGFLAQDVEPVFPAAIMKRSAHNLPDFHFLDSTQLLVNQYGVTQYCINKSESYDKSLEVLSSFIERDVHRLNELVSPSVHIQSSFTGFLENVSTSSQPSSISTSTVESLLSIGNSLMSDIDSLLQSS